jgi:transketolase
MQIGERAGLQPTEKPLRTFFGEALVELCQQNPKVVVLDGDLSNTTKTGLVREAFPDRFFNIGIAEQNLVGIGAGLEECGFIPFLTSITSFLVCNAYDQFRVSIGLAGLNAKVVGSHSGITLGKDGATAMSIEDLALMGAIPSFTLIVPSDPGIMHQAVFAAAKHTGPVFIRSSRSAFPHIYPGEAVPFELGKANLVRQGDDLTIIGTGLTVSLALDAAAMLAEKGIQASVLDMHTVNPLDREAIAAAASETGAIVVAEEHLLHGGVGGNVARIVAEEFPVPMRFVGLTGYTDSGSTDDLLRKFGLTAERIMEQALAALEAKRKRP